LIAKRAVLRLRIVPNARRNEVVGVHGDAIKVKVRAPAMDGKANEALRDFLADTLGVSVRAVEILAGEKSRDKVVAIADLETDEARRRLLSKLEP
jgi:uncharacterized protein (TIGR00251 family)